MQVYQQVVRNKAVIARVLVRVNTVVRTRIASDCRKLNSKFHSSDLQYDKYGINKKSEFTNRTHVRKLTKQFDWCRVLMSKETNRKF